MSDKPISVGDLVMVVRKNYCGCDKGIGRIFRVAKIDRSRFRNWCIWCGVFSEPQDQAVSTEGVAAQLWRLKRIDPDALKDDVPTKEELTA